MTTTVQLAEHLANLLRHVYQQTEGLEATEAHLDDIDVTCPINATWRVWSKAQLEAVAGTIAAYLEEEHQLEDVKVERITVTDAGEETYICNVWADPVLARIVFDAKVAG